MPWRSRPMASGSWWGDAIGFPEKLEAHIRLYDFASGELKALLKCRSNVVLGLAFSPDGKWLISGSGDFDAIVWDVEGKRLLHRLQGHKRRYLCRGLHARWRRGR